MSWYVNTWNNNAVGPFDTAEAAAAWGSGHLENGTITISRLTDPASVAREVEPGAAASSDSDKAQPATEPSPELLQPNDGTAA